MLGETIMIIFLSQHKQTCQYPHIKAGRLFDLFCFLLFSIGSAFDLLKTKQESPGEIRELEGLLKGFQQWRS